MKNFATFLTRACLHPRNGCSRLILLLGCFNLQPLRLFLLARGRVLGHRSGADELSCLSFFRRHHLVGAEVEEDG